MRDDQIAQPDPGFGRTFTDHMVVAHYRGDRWSQPEVVAFGPLSLSPAAMSLHYGQAIFEGLKAYRQPDGSVSLFRPAMNAKRFSASADRLAMPAVDEDMFVQSCLDLVGADEDAVPSVPGQSLYLRPMMIATEPALGVRPATEYLYAVIASPAGAYFAAGMRPISVWLAEHSVRAAPGGTGAAKVAGNYAASLAAKAEALAVGCDDVLFLDAHERRWVEELSGMNLVFVEQRGESAALVSPAPNGTILDGVTRRSVLELATHLGYETIERPVSIDEIFAGGFDEAFACGTAAVIAPIGSVRSSAGTATFAGGDPGPVTVALRRALVDLQEGTAGDPFSWRLPLRPKALLG